MAKKMGGGKKPYGKGETSGAQRTVTPMAGPSGRRQGNASGASKGSPKRVQSC